MKENQENQFDKDKVMDLTTKGGFLQLVNENIKKDELRNENNIELKGN